MAENAAEILRCERCGAIAMLESEQGTICWRHYVVCTACDLCGPGHERAITAVTDWNAKMLSMRRLRQQGKGDAEKT